MVRVGGEVFEFARVGSGRAGSGRAGSGRVGSSRARRVSDSHGSGRVTLTQPDLTHEV